MIRVLRIVAVIVIPAGDWRPVDATAFVSQRSTP